MDDDERTPERQQAWQASPLSARARDAIILLAPGAADMARLELLAKKTCGEHYVRMLRFHLAKLGEDYFTPAFDPEDNAQVIWFRLAYVRYYSKQAMIGAVTRDYPYDVRGIISYYGHRDKLDDPPFVDA